MDISKELESLREVTHDPTLEIIGLDDTFDFECQQCGKCCTHRGDIILNPFDVFRAAKYLGITCTEFLHDYTTPDYGGKSKIPMVLLASDKKTGYCPLLKLDVKNGCKFKCLVHEAKPGACWNHPIGIVFQANVNEDGGIDLAEKATYVKVSQCDNSKGHNHPQLVRDWVKPSIDYAEEIKYAHMLQSYVEKHFSAKLFDFVMSVMEMPLPDDAPEGLKEAQSHVSTIKEAFFTMYIAAVYANYDTDKPFIEQAKANMEALDVVLQGPADLLKKLVTNMPDIVKDMVKEIMHDEHCLDAYEEGNSND